MMKFLLSIFAVAALALTACSKDEDQPTNPDPNPTTNNTMSASINGNAWTPATVIASRSSGTILQIVGSTTDMNSGYQLAIQMFDSSVGEKDINMMTGMVTVVKYTSGSMTSETATSGKINITKSTDTEVEGTFNAIAGGYTVTNGTFKAKF